MSSVAVLGVALAAACSQRYGAEDGAQPIDRVDGSTDGASSDGGDGGTPDGSISPDGATVDGGVTPSPFVCVAASNRICLDFEDGTLGSAQGFGVKASGAQIVSASRARNGKVGASATLTSLQGGRVSLGRALPMVPSVVRMDVHVYLESPAASFDLFGVQADDSEGQLLFMATVRNSQLGLYNGRAYEPNPGLATQVPTNRWLSLVLTVDFAKSMVTLEQDKVLVVSGMLKANPTQVALTIGPGVSDSSLGTYGYDDIQIDF